MDATDRKLVAILQAQGRISNADLARKSGLAASTTLERVRRLEERGVIRGYHALLDSRSLGFGVHAMVLISLSRHQVISIDDFEDQVRAIPEAISCYHLAGRHDYILHVAVRDNEHLGELVKRSVAAVPGVERLETLLVLSTVKEDAGLPLDPPGAAGDVNS